MAMCIHTCLCVCHRGTGVNHGLACCEGPCELCKSPIARGNIYDHLQKCHNVTDEVLKSEADARKEHDRGYDDGKEGRPCQATSLKYLQGYRRGKKARELEAVARSLNPHK